jgi:hypothetical protein
LNGFEPKGRFIAMPHVPNWIGYVGLVLQLIFCGAFLGGVPLLAMIFLLLCFAMVVVENRYERGLMGTRSER